MEKQLVIDDLSQLKSISDPFRIHLLQLLYDTPKTGQNLADELDLPRSKVHYHLNELQKNGIIEIVQTEQKNSIIQKFYAPVAEQVVPNVDILNYNPNPASTAEEDEQTSVDDNAAPDSDTQSPQEETDQGVSKELDENGDVSERNENGDVAATGQSMSEAEAEKALKELVTELEFFIKDKKVDDFIDELNELVDDFAKKKKKDKVSEYTVQLLKNSDK